MRYAVWGLRVVLLAALVWAVIRAWRDRERLLRGGVRGALACVAPVLVLAVFLAASAVVPRHLAQATKAVRAAARPTAPATPPPTAAPGGPAPKVSGARPAQALAAGTDDPAVTGARNRPPMHLTLTPTGWGGYQDFTVPGPRSGFTGTVTVWFPPSYTQEAHAATEYPVIEGFHGIKPAPYAFFQVVQFDRLIQAQVQAGRMREALVVIPHWAPDGVDTECVDSTHGKVATWLTQDVPAWVYDHLRVQPGRASFSAFGMSAGGWCANMAAGTHPRTFGTAISLGGYWRPDFDPPFEPFGPGSREWATYDLVAKAASAPPPIAAWALTSTPDELSYPSNAEIAARAQAPLSVTSVVLPRGNHGPSVWLPHLPSALAWLGATSPGFAAR